MEKHFHLLVIFALYFLSSNRAVQAQSNPADVLEPFSDTQTWDVYVPDNQTDGIIQKLAHDFG